jgi:demethylmenaquinone methyltransferase/2-methoxy-6-polyprenyl-1,4-benzoquinol methylase
MAGDPYRRFARLYDRVLEPMNAPLRGIGMKLCPPGPGMRVLDVGCGTGALLEDYLGAGCEGHGVDLSPAMLDQARSRLGDGAELHLADAADLPYPDGRFDLVVAATLLHELDETTRRAALEEMARVLADDGRVLVIDFHRGALRLPKGWLLRGFSLLTEVVAGVAHFRNYRAFMRNGGLPGALPGTGLGIAEERLVAGGNIALHVLSTAGPA